MNIRYVVTTVEGQGYEGKFLLTLGLILWRLIKLVISWVFLLIYS